LITINPITPFLSKAISEIDMRQEELTQQQQNNFTEEFLMIMQIIRGKTQLKTIPHVCFGNPIHLGMFNQSAQVGTLLQ
jgi:hypothetical protein